MLTVIEAVAGHLARKGALPAGLESSLRRGGWLRGELTTYVGADSSTVLRMDESLGSSRSVQPRPDVSVTLSQAQALVAAMAHDRSLLLLAPPGVGKTQAIRAIAERHGLPCRSLLGTQIAAEDVTGVPRLIGERTVFCPPRVLLPEDASPFCLFLDELPASSPDVQKALYSVLLERRIGEHPLPAGTWVVAAGNRAQDRALVRSMSSALVNRLLVAEIRVDAPEWLAWAEEHGVRREIREFIERRPEALLDEAPADPRPFSTPRSWASLARALDLAERAGVLHRELVDALAFGTVSAPHAAAFVAARDARALGEQLSALVLDPARLPERWDLRVDVLDLIRDEVRAGRLRLPEGAADRFLLALAPDERNAILTDTVEAWAQAGACDAFVVLLEETAGSELTHG